MLPRGLFGGGQQPVAVMEASQRIEQIELRLANASEEMEAWRDYRYTIISGSTEEDLGKFRAIMRAERYLSRRMILA